MIIDELISLCEAAAAAVEKIIQEIIPEFDTRTDNYAKKLIGANNLPMLGY